MFVHTLKIEIRRCQLKNNKQAFGWFKFIDEDEVSSFTGVEEWWFYCKVQKGNAVLSIFIENAYNLDNKNISVMDKSYNRILGDYRLLQN